MKLINRHSHTDGSLSRPQYRADIDGLRAIAVLSVVGFHAFPKSFKGGFIGVDVFFVISGFLISHIIFESLGKGSFSFREFYARRVRRIFPSLIVVLAACYAIGGFVLFADEYAQLSKHIVAGAGFVANFTFWREAGYFDKAAEAKPLLHLWSLGIEEQFYIVWPLLLFFTWRRRLNFLLLTVLVFLISFAFNITSARSDLVAGFYSPLSRFWELMMGSMLAYLTLHKSTIDRVATGLGPIVFKHVSPRHRTILQDAKASIGIILIFLGIFGLNEKSTFPGWWALLPTMGTYLLISAGPRAWVNRHILSNRVLVWMGLISYPLYLWHWPLLSFARIIESREPTEGIRIVAVLISIVLAWTTYKLIERPVRHSKKRLVAILLAVMILEGSVGFVTYINDGYPSEQRPMQAVTERGIGRDLTCDKQFNRQPLFNYCKSNADASPSIAVIGDSHAQAIYDGLVARYGHTHRIILMAHSGCPPLIGTDVYPAKQPGAKQVCRDIYQQILRFIEDNPVSTVFLVSRGPSYLNGGPGPEYLLERSDAKSTEEAFYLGLRQMVSKLQGRHVYILIENPRFDYTPLECARRFRLSSDCHPTINRQAHDTEQNVYRKILENIAAEFKDVTLLDPSNYFCNEKNCSQLVSGTNLYADTHHLTKIGGKKLIEYFVNSKMLPLTFSSDLTKGTTGR